ncbi:MAG: hypothetical protein HFJ09_05795 [Lachnospiraceae bacterium]|nr:hypothetical protein [Lachnospiraceae bacterium]
MKQQFSIIDVFCGIGGMSKGFLDAGYQVNEAIDLDKEKVSIYNNIFGENIAKCQDICSMNPKEIRDADIITGEIIFNCISIAGKKREEDYPLNKYMISLVHDKRPKAILLEVASVRMNIIQEICGCYANIGYHMYYEKLSGQSYSGLPFHDVKIYIVGIRKDLDSEEFYFPKACYNKNDIDEKGYLFEKNVDSWYRRINRIENYKFEEKKIYIRHLNKFHESNLIMNGSMFENFLCDGEGLRRCTHIEMARLKGLALYDYNEYKNKRLMYRYISQASNAIVISYIAKALREYLRGEKSTKDTTICFSEEQLIAQSNMKPLIENVQNEKIDLEEENNDVCPKDEWDELIDAVCGQAKNNLEHGRSLEKLMLKFFSEVEGFQCQPNARTETEEIDIWILNKSKDELFVKESNLILCECKNWKDKIGRVELSTFIEKMKNRNGRCKLGFFIAWNGVTDNFEKELLRITRGEEVIVLLTKEGIVDAIKTENIMKYLQDEYSKALLR